MNALLAAALFTILSTRFALGDECQPASTVNGKRHFVVSSLETEPYVMSDKTNKIQGYHESNGFTGYLVEVLSEIFRRMNATFEITIASDRKRGDVNSATQIGSGAVGDVWHCRADMTAVDLPADPDYLQYVALTAPFQHTGFAILAPKPSGSDATQGLFSLFDAYDTVTWVVLLAACILIFLFLALVYWLSPFGALSGKLRSSAQDAGPQSKWLNAGWWAYTSLVQQRPESMSFVSGRFLIGGWFFVVVVFLSAYMANFTAFRMSVATGDPLDSIDSFSDLASQTRLHYGAPSWIGRNLMRAPSEEMNRVGRFLLSRPEESLEVDAGVEKVQKNGSYAYVHEYWSLRYRASKEPCNTRLVGRTLAGDYYTLALPKNMPYEEEINHRLLDVLTDGALDVFQVKWFDFGPCKDHDLETLSGRRIARKLGMKEMGGLFVLLLIVIVLALVVAFVEKLVGCKFEANVEDGKETVDGDGKSNPLYEVKAENN